MDGSATQMSDKNEEQKEYIDVTLKDGSTRKIRIELLKDHNLDEAIEILADGAVGHPLEKHFKLTKDDWREFARLACEKAVPAGLSYVAVDESMGEHCAITIHEDVTEGPLDISRLSNPNWETFTEFIEQVKQRAWSPKDCKKGKILHNVVSAVHPAYRRTGIMRTMKKLSYLHARRLGYERITLEATGTHIQKANEKAGFNLDLEMPYRPFQDKHGDYPFKDYDDSEHPSCHALSLDFNTMEESC